MKRWEEGTLIDVFSDSPVSLRFTSTSLIARFVSMAYHKRGKGALSLLFAFLYLDFNFPSPD